MGTDRLYETSRQHISSRGEKSKSPGSYDFGQFELDVYPVADQDKFQELLYRKLGFKVPAPIGKLHFMPTYRGEIGHDPVNRANIISSASELFGSALAMAGEIPKSLDRSIVPQTVFGITNERFAKFIIANQQLDDFSLGFKSFTVDKLGSIGLYHTGFHDLLESISENKKLIVERLARTQAILAKIRHRQ